MPKQRGRPRKNPEQTTTAMSGTPSDIAVQTVPTTIKPKQHRNRPDLANFGEEHVEPGDNARYLRMARVAFDLPPIDIADPKQVEKRIGEYFDFCEQNDRKPNIVGMANWIGVDRTTLALWKRGDYRSETHFDVIKRAVSILEEIWLDYMQNGKMNPASGIFIAKNLLQYKDVQDVVVTPNNPLESGDADQTRQKYLEALPEIASDE